MSRKTKRKRRDETATPAAPRGVARPRWVAAALIACALLGAAFAATRIEPVRRAVGMRPLLATPAPQQGGLQMAKENVYAGGRLVATEEPQPVATPTPTPTPTGNAPTGLTATATSASAVRLEWNAASGAIGYVVERRSAPGAQPVETATNSVAPNFDDTSLAPGDNSYLYRVKAVYVGGFSDYGNYDLATTVPFTDGSLQGVFIKADHLKELRRAVRAVRIMAGRGEPTWSHADPVSSPANQRRSVFLADVTELRAQVDEALTALDAALGVQVFFKPYPESPALVQYGQIYAAHFEQIRERVR